MQIPISRWLLRDFQASDEDSLVKYANNYNIWINLRDGFPHPYTRKDARNWLQVAINYEHQRIFAISDGREAIGSIGVHLFRDIYRHTAEIGYWLGEPFWGQGIATLAVKEMIKFAFRALDINRLQAEVFEWNPASMRVLEKAGFTLEARMRKNVTKADQTIDSLIYVVFRE